MTPLAEAERVAANMGGDVIAAAVFQRKGRMYTVLVEFPHNGKGEHVPAYVVWTFIWWPEQEYGSFSSGDYFTHFDENPRAAAFARFLERNKGGTDSLLEALPYGV